MRALTLVLAAALLLAAPQSPLGGERHSRIHWTDDAGIVLVHDDGDFEIIADGGKGGYLGVTLGEVDEDLAEEAGLSQGGGALVRSVFDDSPADEAGIEAGDIILKFDEEGIEDSQQLAELVRKQDPGAEVKIEVWRDGKKKVQRVTLAERDAQIFLRPGRQFPRTWHAFHDDLEDLYLHVGGAGVRIGVEIRDLDEDLAEYFPGTDGEGALVLSVDEDSPAGKGGLKAGDVILRVDEHDVGDVDDLRRALRKSEDEESVEVEYLRRGKRETTRVEPERSGAFLMRSFDDGRKQLIKLRDRLDREDVEEKLEQMQEKLRELEKKLEKLED